MVRPSSNPVRVQKLANVSGEVSGSKASSSFWALNWLGHCRVGLPDSHGLPGVLNRDEQLPGNAGLGATVELVSSLNHAFFARGVDIAFEYVAAYSV